MAEGKNGIKKHQELIPPEFCREDFSLMMAISLGLYETGSKLIPANPHCLLGYQPLEGQCPLFEIRLPHC